MHAINPQSCQPAMPAADPPCPLHPAAAGLADECRAGQLSRREFLTRATALGLGTGMAYGLLGLVAPTARASATPQPGGALRLQMELKPLVDPRLAAWPQVGNILRGWLETLVEYRADGTISGKLLAEWQADATAQSYLLRLRPGVRWSNGDDFTSADVLHNLRRWCDSTVPGNSMAARLAALIDPASGQLAAGAVELPGPHELRLNLSFPDVTLIASLTDYPALVLHPSYTGGDPLADPIGTGPYFPDNYSTGAQATLLRRDEHWWNRGNGAWLARIDYADYGTDPAATLAAARAGAIDMTYQTIGEFIAAFDALGWQRSQAQSAATLAVRFNQRSAQFANAAVRRAICLAVDNAVVLELGHGGLGLVGENHHVCPIHPDYAELPMQRPDKAAARAMIGAAGMMGHEFELISLDDDWQAASCNAIAAQCRDAGIRVRRRLLPGPTFWAGWKDHPWSATEWTMRPLGIQGLMLAYHSTSAWNESGFANAEFDALLLAALAISDAAERRSVMQRLQQILQEQGVLIQPFWRFLCNHHQPLVQGAEIHPAQEHHHTEWWLADG